MTAVPDGNPWHRLVPGSVDYEWLRGHIRAPIQLDRAILIPPVPAIGQNGTRLAWPADEAMTHRVESTTHLGSWQPVEVEVRATAGQVVADVPDAMSGPRRFYRLVSE